jgi:hypothetical protein
VISPRFSEADLSAADASSVSPVPSEIHIHLHVPDTVSVALMQLVATLTGQRTLFDLSQTTFTNVARVADAGSGPTPVSPNVAPVSPVNVPADEPGDDDMKSLLDVYRKVVKPRRKRAAGAAAIAEHESGMRAFDRFFERWQADWAGSEIGLRFEQPKVFLTAPDVLSMFSKYLITVEGLAAQTVIKRITNVKIVAKALKIDAETPTPGEVKRLFSEHAKKQEESRVGDTGNNGPKRSNRRIPAWKELDAMATWATQAQYPYGEHAPYFWRGWIRFLAFIGPRSRDVVSVITRKDGLLKEHVIFDTLCPVEDVNNAIGTPLHSPHGWIFYPIGKDQHSENRHILFPMPLWMRNWLKFFIELSPCERVFPSVMTKKVGWLSQKQMTTEWNRIVAAAGVDPRLVPSEGTGNRIALRKFAANWWSLETSKSLQHAALADKMENYILHHVPKSTSKKHYVSDQAKLLPVMLELMSRFPLPGAEAPPVSLLPE